MRHFQQVTCLKIISFVFAILQIRMTLIYSKAKLGAPYTASSDRQQQFRMSIIAWASIYYVLLAINIDDSYRLNM